MSNTSLNTILNSYPVKTSQQQRPTPPRVPYAVNCSLCGCNGASVRCSKCDGMAFCIGCDDMYHRHPKRRTHLRQAVALEFIQAMEKHQTQQQTTNINNFLEVAKNNIDSSNQNQVLYPWRISRSIPRVPETFWAHPSKMPIPPPRRKKKTLSFAGIKDTFKRLVNPNYNSYQLPQLSPQQQQQQQFIQNEPIYATIKSKQQQQSVNSNKKLSIPMSVFRPLPPTPATDLLYENMRKSSMPENGHNNNNSNNFAKKNKEFASSNDLTNRTSISSSVSAKIRGSSLPRKNFSYQDLCSGQSQSSLNNPVDTIHPCCGNGGCSPGFRGSSQSLYPGMPLSMCNHHGQPMTSSPMIPNRNPHHCPSCHCHQFPPTDYYYYWNGNNPNSLSNSLEEIGNRNHDDDLLTDDENEDDLDLSMNNGRFLSRSVKNRLRRAKMKRSQSTYTMIGDEEEDFAIGQPQKQCDYNRFESNSSGPSYPSIHQNGTSVKLRKSSPSPSIKSTKSNDKYRYSDISDSSSSSHSKSRIRIISKNKKSNELEERRREEKEPDISGGENLQEMVNEIGQWSCRFCTFLNDSDKNICEICSKTRLNVKSQPLSGSLAKVRKVSINIEENNRKNDDEVKLQPNESSNKVDLTEHEIIFDESFIKEQIEIEKELQRRKENERKIAEENQKLLGKIISENQESESSSINRNNQTEIPKNSTDSSQTQASENGNENSETDGKKEEEKFNKKNEEIDQAKIVAQIIEEKITEQFDKLKLEQQQQQQKNDEQISSKKNVVDQPVTTSNYMVPPQTSIVQTVIPSNPIQSQIVNGISPHLHHVQQQLPEVFPSQQHSNGIQNQFYPSQPNLFNNSNPIQPQQGWLNNPNPNPSYPPPPAHHQRTMSSCSSISSMSMLSGGYQQPSYFPVPTLQDPNINRFSSLDDLQSMSSVTSASLFYPDSKSSTSSSMMNSGRQIIQILREAEKKGYSADDLEVAIQFSPHSPLEWLEENWKNLCEVVMTMSNNQIVELQRASGNKNLNFPIITEKDAKAALRLCKGNVWQSVEKCIQRHQENKSYGTPADVLKNLTYNNSNSNDKLPQTSKSKSFSMKITGLGSGKANNDANYGYQDGYMPNPEALLYAQHSKLPMEEFLSFKEPTEKNEDLAFYLQKIKDSKDFDQLNRNELEVLIQNWQYEKAKIDLEREQMKILEKEREKMQKMIDIQKRIGGYLSDGTTTEEELDREVARVFQNKTSGPEFDIDSDQTPTFTADEDILIVPGPSGMQSKINENHNNMKQKIESKLIELSIKSNAPPIVSIERISSGSNSSYESVIDRNFEDAASSSHQNIDLNPKTISPELIRERLVPMDRISNFAESSRKVENVLKPMFCGDLSVPIKKTKNDQKIQIKSVKLQEAKVVTYFSGLKKISSQVDDIIHHQPLSTTDPIKKNSPKKPPIQSDSSQEESPKLRKNKTVNILVHQSSDESQPGSSQTNKVRLRTPKLSYSSKSLSLTEYSSSEEEESTIPQKPVFSKLRGFDKIQKAQVSSFENLNSNSKSNGDNSTERKKTTSFKLYKSESIESYLHEKSPFDQLKKERARRLIVEKLRSVESLNSSSSSTHVGDKLDRSSNSLNVDPKFRVESSQKPHTRSLEMITSTTKSDQTISLESKNRMAKDDYSYEFQWARTELECELCAQTVPVQDIVVMITCTHYACKECIKRYLTVQIRERQRLVITCPFCNEPEISPEQDEQVFEYLAIFDPFVRHIIDPDVYELFQRKLRDRALMRDPNFMWCAQCSSGFIVPNPKALTVICPDCKTIFCRSCKKPWKSQHLNTTCEEYSEWEKLHDLDYAEKQLDKHLQEFGIECPNCHFRYQLAKGGCMHFRCTQCSYDFCGGCSRPFKLGSRCFRAKVCERLGLHAHHPRNCLFYLRDKDIADLQKLLDQHKIEYKTKVENEKASTRCQVMEQKEVNFSMKDRPCNRYVEMAGLCKLHYKEYLGNLIYNNKIDPIPILSESELELTLKRENIRIPTHLRGEDYKKKLVELILERIPLDSK